MPREEMNMPQALDNHLKATAELREAHELISLIGKESLDTTARTPGKLHAVNVSITICYQAHDGAKNYHECKALDRAMSMALRAHYFDRVLHQGLQELERAVSATREAAAAEYKAMFDGAAIEP
jgi:hypothetical protein